MRLALRSLRRSPAFGVSSVATIGVAIALAATTFAIIDGVLFRPLPYPNSSELWSVAGTSGETGTSTASLAARDVEYLKEASPVARFASYAGARVLRGRDQPEHAITTASVDPEFFDVLGLRPRVGGFSAVDFDAAAAGEAIPAVVSDAFWRNRLGSDPRAIGRVIDLVDARLRIVGVLPGDFVFPGVVGRSAPDVLLPLVLDEQERTDRWRRSLDVVVRTSAAVPMADLHRTLDAALASRVTEYAPRPRTLPGPYIGVELEPLRDVLGRSERRLFSVTFAGASLIVLLGCINVSGLIIARRQNRLHEIGVLRSLGASRRHVLQHLLGEVLVIALCGTAVGLVAAQPLLDVVRRLLPDTVQLLNEPSIDWRVACFSAVLTATSMMVVTGIAFAFYTHRCHLSGWLEQRMDVQPRPGISSVLLACESAMGLILTLAGSLVLASWIGVRAADPGFDRDRLVAIEVLTPGAVTTEQVRERQGLVLERLRAHPATAGVATLSLPLLENTFVGSGFRPPITAQAAAPANEVPISANYFAVAGVRVVDGTIPTAGEFERGGSVVISNLIADSYWPNQRAVGQELTAGQRVTRVAAVVEEVRLGSQADVRWGEIYVPASSTRRTQTVFLVRTEMPPDLMAPEYAAVLNRDVAGVLVRRAESLEHALQQSVRLFAFRGVIFTAAGLAGLGIVLVGVAGLVAMNVSHRRKELGIRAALGAQRPRLVRLVVGAHLRPVAVGTMIGALGFWWTAEMLRAFLYAHEPYDAGLWILGAVALLTVAVLGAWIPAHRASGVDPARVLRSE